MKPLISEPLPTTNQEFFNRAWKWASREDYRKCVRGETDRCLYRSEDNTNACLIGCCIPDDKYDPHFEDVGARFVLSELGIDELQEDFFEEIQTCHDRSDSREDCLQLLRDLADKYELTIPND